MLLFILAFTAFSFVGFYALILSLFPFFVCLLEWGREEGREGRKGREGRLDWTGLDWPGLDYTSGERERERQREIKIEPQYIYLC